MDLGIRREVVGGGWSIPVAQTDLVDGNNDGDNDGPPSPGILRCLATVGTAFLVGFVRGALFVVTGHIGKYRAGSYVGVGIGLALSVGISGGLPWIIGGAIYFCLSTALSISKLDQFDPKTVLLHILDSLCIGAIGVGSAFLPFNSPDLLMQVAANTADTVLLFAAVLCDFGFTPTYLGTSLTRKLAGMLPKPDTQISRNIRKAMERYYEQLISSDGAQVGDNYFHLEDDGSECITNNVQFKANEKRKWCLLRTGHKYEFITEETADQLLSNQSSLTNGKTIKADDIIRDEAVLNLLEPKSVSSSMRNSYGNYVEGSDGLLVV